MASEKDDDAQLASEEITENVADEAKVDEAETKMNEGEDNGAVGGQEEDVREEETREDEVGENEPGDSEPGEAEPKDDNMGDEEPKEEDDMGEEKPNENDEEPNDASNDLQDDENDGASGEELEADVVIDEEGQPQKVESQTEQPEEPEKPKELEEDSPDDGRPQLSTPIGWSDSTLNVMPTCGGKLLMTLCEGGFQYLLAAARGDTGMTSGRYLFEVKIVEVRMPVEHPGKGAQQIPQQLLRLGFTDGKSSLFISDEDGSIGFDSEGGFITSKSKKYFTKRFQPHEVFGILLNLDPESQNYNTVSLFRDGLRVCEPKQIPDSLKGKTLFPTVNYRNMTLHVNFGPTPLAPLPFKCRMVQNAAEVDVVVDKTKVLGQCEVVLPIGLPDEGTFDWLDGFLKENPDYVEVSDRAILEWARKSGLVRPRGFAQRACNDRPGMDFGIREMDDLSVRRLIRSVAPVLRRKYVIMEVRNNLLVAQRKKVLEHFHSDFKKIAIVAMGEPSQQHKDKVQQDLLAKKRETTRNDAQLDYEKRQASNVSEEKAHEDGDSNKEAKAEESLEEILAKAETVELSDEEHNTWFRKPSINDLTAKDLATSFVNFSLPSEGEGFDEIRYTWQREDSGHRYLKQWIAEHKLTQKVEDLQPGSWFQEQTREWQSLSAMWHKAQDDYLDGQRNKPRKVKDDNVKESGGVDSEKKATEEKKEDESKDEPNDDASTGINVADIDSFLVEDICDAGNKEPLFAHFAFEDWEMLKLRFEIHTLVHSFRRDLNDVERPSFHESHLAFYYNKYYKNNFSVNKYGVNSVTELIELISDTIEVVSKNSILEPQLSDDTPLENFVRLTEDERRRRQRLLDSGCESAALKVQRAPPAASSGRGYNQQRQQQRGYNQQSRGGGGHQQTSRGAIGSGSGYAGRAPPGNNSRPPPTSRAPPHSSGYSSNAGTRSYGGTGGSSYGSNHGGSSSRGGSTYGGSYGGSGGSRSYGSSAAPPSRSYGTTAPAPPARGYGGSSHSGGSSYGSSGAQKRPYPSSSSNPPPSKYPRGSGSYGTSSGSGSRYGSGGHGGGSYRR